MKTVREDNELDGGADERLRIFIGFWTAAAVALASLGIATLAALDHGRRVGLALLVLGAACLAIALLVRRAARLPRG